MASIWQDKRSGKWLIKFLFAGTAYTRSSYTSSRRAALHLKSTVEETIALVQTGRIELPNATVDPAVWVMSGGKLDKKPLLKSPKLSRLDEIIDAYEKDQVDKAESTMAGERPHYNHLKSVLGVEAKFGHLSLEDMQRYVNCRLKQDNRYGGTICGKTVKKELVTFMQIWDWARQRKLVTGPCPSKDPNNLRKWAVSLPKADASEKFMTWSEIERRIARGGLTALEERELWKFLFLDESQLSELLGFVKQRAKKAFIYPMFLLAGYTGARRSEICRSRVDDIRFDENIIIVRERKRRKDMASTTREVPLHSEFRAEIQEWIESHPGGQFTIAAAPPSSDDRNGKSTGGLSVHDAHRSFKSTLLGSKWQVVRGFHVLRHSFGAICTRSEVPMNVTAKWMGHTTEEMRTLYQHLFPQDERRWMETLSISTVEKPIHGRDIAEQMAKASGESSANVRGT